MTTANLIGQRLGDYRLIRLLGTGTFGQVYLGQHVSQQTQVAVKVLRIYLTPQTLKKFLTEARTFRLQHPHIVQLLDFGLEGDIPFLVMDYAPNGTLRQLHPPGTPLPLAQTLSYVQQVAAALQYAHEMRVIHRDVKPQNMLLGRNHDVLLSDFGVAVVAHTDRSLTTYELAGTLPYMAPEQLRNKPQPASDQYALGIAVYEWLCGDRPFQGTQWEIMRQHLYSPPAPLRQKMPTIPPAVEAVVQRVLAKDPQERFSSVQAFAIAFEQACRTEERGTTRKPQKGEEQVTQGLSASVSSALFVLPPEASPAGQGTQVSISSGQRDVFLSTPPPGNAWVGSTPLPAMTALVHPPAASSRARPPLWQLLALAIVVLLGSVVGLLAPLGTFGAGHGMVQQPLPTKTAVQGFPTPTPTPTATPAAVILAQDTFQRGNQPSWGRASDGQLWEADATSGLHFSLANHAGRIADGQGALQGTLGPQVRDAEVVLSGSVSQFQQQGANLGAVLHWSDASNWYKAYLDGVQLVLLKDVSGTISQLGAIAFPAQSGKFYMLRFRVVGAYLTAKAWPVGQVEPATWMVTATDSALPTGFGGVRVFLQNGVVVTVTSFLEVAASKSP